MKTMMYKGKKYELRPGGTCDDCAFSEHPLEWCIDHAIGERFCDGGHWHRISKLREWWRDFVNRHIADNDSNPESDLPPMEH